MQLQRTSDDAAATIYFLSFLYIDLRHPRAPPATDEPSDPLGSQQLGFALVGDDDDP